MKVQWILGAAAILCSSVVYADTLAGWTFETSQPTTSGPISPETGAGAASGSHASSSVVYSSPAGNGSTYSYSSNHWTTDDYYQFKASASEYDDISISFDQISSSTGPTNFSIQYSTDGAAFITDPIAYTVSDDGWSKTSASGSDTFTYALPALNNSANIYIRLVNTSTKSAGGGTIGTTGSDRVDNVIISGDVIASVPLPAASLGGVALIGLLSISRSRFRCESEPRLQ